MLLPDFAVRLLRALPEAAIYVTTKGRVVAANAAARKALDLGTETLLDRDFRELVADADEKHATTLRAWSRSTDATPGSFAVDGPSGPTTFNASGSVVLPALDDDPAVLLVRFWPRSEANKFVLLNQKIAELNDEIERRVHVEESLRRSEAALLERAAEAEALNRAKDEFLATLSHELRTPLNAILGWATMLRTRVSDPTLSKPLEVIHRNAQAQVKLIEDILDASRIITGKLRLEIERCDLVPILQEAVEVLKPSTVAKRLEIVLELGDEPCLVTADPNRLRQVVWNLLSNAVKFTDRDGKVHIRLRRDNSRVVLTIADTGCGIDRAFLPFVFDRFRQADSSTTRKAGGLGLGLALVRHLVELHGGSVEAHSDGPGHGATFAITLASDVSPAAPLERRAPSQPPREVGRPLLDGVRVLIVDDDRDGRDLVAAVVADAGGIVETAESAVEAFAAVARFRPQVLVSDVGMPDEDGYSLIRRIRALDSHDGGAIPAIALSAYTRSEDRTSALEAGFTMHIGKPVDGEHLIAAVATALEATR